MDCTMPTPSRGSEKPQARKTETLFCWLFGHKFFPNGTGSHPSVRKHSLSQSIEALDTCIRCGITRGDLGKDHSRGELQPRTSDDGETEGGGASKAA